MREPTTDYNADALDEARGRLERVALDAPLTQAERAYLGSVATRLQGLARQLREGLPAPLALEPEEAPRPPRRLLTRKEAAAVIGCHPNSLINWESRGLLEAKRDYRGWRVYDREALARAMALAAHIPLADD